MGLAPHRGYAKKKKGERKGGRRRRPSKELLGSALLAAVFIEPQRSWMALRKGLHSGKSPAGVIIGNVPRA